MTANLTATPSTTSITNNQPPAARRCGLNKTGICCKESETPQCARGWSTQPPTDRSEEPKNRLINQPNNCESNQSIAEGDVATARIREDALIPANRSHQTGWIDGSVDHPSPIPNVPLS